MACYQMTLTRPDGTKVDWQPDLKRDRRDSAERAWLNLIHGAIRTQAGLDTLWGRAAMADAQQAALDVLTYERTAFVEVGVSSHYIATLWCSARPKGT